MNKQDLIAKTAEAMQTPVFVESIVLVILAALSQLFVLFFLIAYILIKGVPHLTLGSVCVGIQYGECLDDAGASLIRLL